MIIAGGVYVEKCVSPETTQLLGSAGRAALALMRERQDLHLHTFHPPALWPDLEANFVANGIRCTPHASAQRVTFSYLFPLGRPVRTPDRVTPTSTVTITGDQVLGFGCIEGRFNIDAKTVVYDPQGDLELGFRAFGSKAEKLAFVMNADEARSLSGSDEVEGAARAILDTENALAVVVKNGPMGALVATADKLTSVPAYQSASLYKIGSGDIFSATFAHRWMQGHDAASAADQASRQTAAYVEAPTLPLLNPPEYQRPRFGLPHAQCRVVCDQRSLSSKWSLAIIVEALEHLGVDVFDIVELETWRRGPTTTIDASPPRELLIAPDETSAHELAKIAKKRGTAPVIFVDSPSPALQPLYHGDISQALYELCWASI